MIASISRTLVGFFIVSRALGDPQAQADAAPHRQRMLVSNEDSNSQHHYSSGSGSIISSGIVTDDGTKTKDDNIDDDATQTVDESLHLTAAGSSVKPTSIVTIDTYPSPSPYHAFTSTGDLVSLGSDHPNSNRPSLVSSDYPSYTGFYNANAQGAAGAGDDSLSPTPLQHRTKDGGSDSDVPSSVPSWNKQGNFQANGGGASSDYPSSSPSNTVSDVPSASWNEKGIFQANGIANDQSDYPSLTPIGTVSDVPSNVPSSTYIWTQQGTFQSSGDTQLPSDYPSLTPNSMQDKAPTMKGPSSTQPSDFPSNHPSMFSSDFPSTFALTYSVPPISDTPGTEMLASDVPNLQSSDLPSLSPSTQPSTISALVHAAGAGTILEQGGYETPLNRYQTMVDSSTSGSNANVHIDSAKRGSLLGGEIGLALAIIAYASYAMVSKKGIKPGLVSAQTIGSSLEDSSECEEPIPSNLGTPVARTSALGVRQLTTPEQLTFLQPRNESKHAVPNDPVVTLVQKIICEDSSISFRLPGLSLSHTQLPLWRSQMRLCPLLLLFEILYSTYCTVVQLFLMEKQAH
jgi:hypothetical protein